MKTFKQFNEELPDPVTPKQLDVVKSDLRFIRTPEIRKKENTAKDKSNMIFFSLILSFFANHLPVMYVQVPQWADDWAVCAVDIPDAKCHWYVMSPDNTFGEGFDWENAPWFDANGLNDVAPMQAKTVVERLQNK